VPLVWDAVLGGVLTHGSYEESVRELYIS